MSSSDAERRLAQYRPNCDAETKADSLLRAIFRRLLEPLSLILLAAGIVSVVTGDAIGGSIIVAILALSIGLDTVQEGHAVKTADILPRSVALKAEVKRDGAFHQIEVERVVPGDILRVRAGDIIPADALILQSTACTAGEAALTGEPYPVEKRAGVVTALSAGEASNALFRGAVAQTGEALALAVNTGRAKFSELRRPLWRRHSRLLPSSATCANSAPAMRTRLQQMGKTLEIHSSPATGHRGTTLRAAIPHSRPCKRVRSRERHQSHLGHQKSVAQ